LQQPSTCHRIESFGSLVADQWSGSLLFCSDDTDDMVVFGVLQDAFATGWLSNGSFTQVKPEPLTSSDSSSCYFYDGFGLPELEPPEPMTSGASSDVAATPRRDGGGRGGRGEGQALPGRATAAVGQVRRGGRRPTGRGGTEAADGGTDGEGGGRERGGPGKRGGQWKGKEKKV
jgi:EREBP-like factor